jgi:outer membrane protein assembly factor BamB
MMEIRADLFCRCNSTPFKIDSGPGKHKVLKADPVMNAAKLLCCFVFLNLVMNGFGGQKGKEWSEWRGPNASGVDESVPLMTNWNVAEGKNIKWKAPVQGMAHSSPIVWGDKVYVTTAIKPGKVELKVGMYGSGDSADEKVSHQWRLVAFDKATGKALWDTLAYQGVPKLQRHTKASQCNSTPATDGTNIVAIFGSEGLFCFDVSGNIRWKKDIGPMDAGKLYSPPALQWGFASSPLLREGLVVVQCDVVSEQFIAAYRVEDGKEVWKTPRKEVGTWCSPIFDGEGRQVIVNGYKQIGGYDFATGKERWRLSDGGDNPIPTPVIGQGLVFFASAHGKHRPLRAVRLDAMGDITPSDITETNKAIVWVHPRQGSYLPTPIVVGGLLYSCNDNGVLTCFDARTGAIQYSERLNTGSQGFSASPVSDGKYLFFSGESGDVYVVPVGPKFSVVATNSLEEICMATPALSDGMLFFRTREHLLAIGER